MSNSYLCLENKSVFITGGATGIGAAMVKAFANQGCKVAFIDINQAASNQLKQQIDANHTNESAQVWCDNVDVTDTDNLKTAINNAANTFDGIDILINNVASDTRHKTQDISLQQWQSCMQVNIEPAFFASQTVLPYMQQKSAGAIINLSSINALLGPKHMVAYNTAKAGLIGMTKTLANEFGQHNVRVNAILPGWVATDKQLASYLTEQEEQKWMDTMAIKRRISPEEVAKLALFLASDDSAMITGQSISIDGGRTC